MNQSAPRPAAVQPTNPERVERVTRFLNSIKVPVEHHENLIALADTEAKIGAAYAAKLMAKDHEEARMKKELRMHVATECLSGLLANEEETLSTAKDYMARQAVEYADALLAELNK